MSAFKLASQNADILSGSSEKTQISLNGLNGMSKTVAQSMNAYVSAMQSGATATQAMGAAVKTFSTSFQGVTLIITAVVTAISAVVKTYKNHQETLQEMADAAHDSYTSMQEDIGDYQSRVAELRESLDSDDITSEESYEIRKELIAIQDELIENYGREAEGLDLLSGSAEDANRSMKDFLETELEIEARRNLQENATEYEKAVKQMEKERSYNAMFTYSEVEPDQLDEVIDKIYEVADVYDNISLDKMGTQMSMVINGSVEEAQEAMQALQDIFLKYAPGSQVAERLQSNLDDTGSIIEDWSGYYNDYLVQTILSDDTYRDIANNITGLSDALEDAIASGDYEAAAEAFQQLLNFDLSQYEIQDDNIRDYLQSMIDDATKDSYETQIRLNTEFVPDMADRERFLATLKRVFVGDDGVVDLGTIRLMGDLEYGTSNANGIEFTEDQWKSYSSLQEIAERYGVTIEDLIDLLAQQGEVQLSVTEESTAAIADLDEAYQSLESSIGNLNNAMSEMLSGGLTSSTSLAIVEELQEAGENISDYFTVENNGIKLNTAAYREYINTKKEAMLQDLYDKQEKLERQMTDMRGLEDTTDYQNIVKGYDNIVAEIAIYETEMSEACDVTSQFFDLYEDASSRISDLSDFADAMSTGGMSREDALQWIQDYEELADCYDAATNSFIGWEEVVDASITGTYLEYIEQINEELEINTDLTDQEREILIATADALSDTVDLMLSSNKALTVVNKNMKGTESSTEKLKKQVNNVWNSKEFEDARSDLVSLAKQSGITAKDILDLAEDNEYLAALLDESGVSAMYLASIFNDLSINGSGALDGITEDAIRVSNVLSEMEASLRKADEAYEQYQASLGSWEYNDQFSNYQSAYESLGEMFENGEFGADFYRTIDYLYGEGHGADNIKDLYKQYKNLGDYFSEADNGLGFLQKLYDMQSTLGGDWIKIDSNGDYLWNIGPEDFAGIAEGLGMTEEEVAACVEALGMFGDFTEYDPQALVDTFSDLNMTLHDTEGNAILSSQAVRELLESFGYESWQIDQIMTQLEEAEGIEFIDFDVTSNDQEAVEGLLQTLEELAGVKMDGAEIGLTSLKDAMRDLGMSDEDIAAFMEVLNELGYTFVDVEGETESFNKAIRSLNQSTLDNLKDSAKDALSTLNEMTGWNFSFNFDASSVDEAETELTKILNMLETFRDPETGQFNIEAEGYEECMAIFEALWAQKCQLTEPAIMKVDTSEMEEGLANGILLVQEFYAAYDELEKQKALGLDTSEAQQSLQGIANEISNLDPEILAEIGIDEESLEAIMDIADTELDFEAGVTLNEDDLETVTTAITEIDVDDLEMRINTDPTLEALNQVIEVLDEISGKLTSFSDEGINVTITGTASDDLQKLEDFTIKDKPFNVEANTDKAKSKLNEINNFIIRDKSFSVTVKDYATTTLTNIRNLLNSLPTTRQINVVTHYTTTGIATGTATLATGTAYQNGDWGIKGSGTALVGELGQELVVRDGHYFTVGDKSPEFFQYHPGDIVFNADQTSQIFKYGHILNGKKRGNSYAEGTAFASGRVSVYNKATGTKYTSSYKKATTTNTSTSNSITSAVSEATDAAEDFLEIMDWIEIAIDRIESQISHLDTVASSAFYSMTKRASAMSDEMSMIADEIELQEQAYDAYIAAANAIDLNENYKELVRNGAIALEEITDEDLYDTIKDYQDLYDKAEACVDAISDLEENIRQLYKDTYDIVVTQFDAILDGIGSQQSLLEAYITQIETSGHIVSERYYNLLIESRQEELNLLMEEESALMQELNNAVNSGAIEEGSEAWYEMNQQIESVKLSITEVNTEMTELYNTIRQLKWDAFDYGMDSISNLIDEMDFFLDLLDYQDLYDEIGQLTTEGMSAMELTLSKYNTYLAQSEKYAEELADIEEQLTRDPYNTDLLERRQELIELQRESILSSYSERDALVSLVEEGINVNLNALNDLINSYEDALDASSSLYEYQKKIEDQQKTISDIEKQLAAYQNDYSEEARSTVQQLRNQLNEAQENLEEQQYQRYISDQKELLSDLYDEYEQVMVRQLDDVDALITNCTSAVERAGNEITDCINDVANSVGYNPTEDFSGIIDSLSTVDNSINGLGDVINSAVDRMMDFADNLYANGSVSGLESEMKANSIAWWTATSTEEQEALHNRNIELSDELSAITGETGFYSKNGVWYDAQGNALYSLGTDEIIDAIIDRMQSNSADWASASDTKRAELESENEELAQRIAALTGLAVTRENGVWYIGGQELYNSNTSELISSLVDQMKANSEAWNTASSTKQAQLSNDNVSIANSIAALTGEEVYRDANGVWWIGNKRLYDAYHTGGIVGGGTAADNEMLVNLLNDEVVLTHTQFDELSEKFSSGISDMLNDTITSMLVAASVSLPDSPTEFVSDSFRGLKNNREVPESYYVTNNNENTITFELPNVQEYEDFMNQITTDNKFAKWLQSVTVDPITGKSSLQSRSYKW